LQHFVPLNSKFTLMLNGEVGYADGYGSTPNLPFFKNFYAGGVNSVRGYKTSSLGTPGTIVTSTDNNTYRIGGNRRAIGNAELLWSLPGMEKSFRMGWFFDGGQVFGKGEKFDVGELRYSTGLTAAWISPIGPLKFSYGVPMNKKEGDKAETFQFQMGTTF
jgi:outer membrane protein insertion porin family